MKKNLIFVLLMSGVILSPMGAYAMNDEGGAPRTSIPKAYRVPVTVLPSGDVELPSGTKLPSTTTAAGALKAMTEKDKELGQELEHKPLQPGTTYFSIYNNSFMSTKHRGLYPGFLPLKGALETIEGSTQQPGASPHVGGSSSTPSATPTPQPELETAD